MNHEYDPFRPATSSGAYQSADDAWADEQSPAARHGGEGMEMIRPMHSHTKGEPMRKRSDESIDEEERVAAVAASFRQKSEDIRSEARRAAKAEGQQEENDA